MFLYSPGTHYTGLADLEFREIHWPLPRSTGIKSLFHHALKFRNLKKNLVGFFFKDRNMESFNQEPKKSKRYSVLVEGRHDIPHTEKKT